MSRRGLARLNPRRDQNEPEVIDALEKCGWNVKRINGRGMPDLLLWRGQGPQIRFVEVKQPKKKLRASQEWWSGVLPVAVLRSIDDVVEWNRSQ